MGRFIAVSKSCTNLKILIDDEYSNLTLVYEQVKNVEKPFEKDHTNCKTLFSTKRNTLAERYDMTEGMTQLVFNHEHCLDF